MSDNKSQLATFRVEPELWEAFKSQARKNGKTASDVLNEFVQSYANSSTTVSTETPQLDNLDELIEEKLATRLAPIVQRLTAVERGKRVRRPEVQVQEKQSLGEYALQG